MYTHNSQFFQVLGMFYIYIILKTAKYHEMRQLSQIIAICVWANNVTGERGGSKEGGNHNKEIDLNIVNRM